MTPRLIMRLDVAAVEPDRGGILRISLKHPRRPALPPATAGAHVDLHLPDGRVRQYSLFGDPADRSVYRVAVKREEAGRGGSAYLHDNLREGGTLMVSAPRNHFELEPEAERYMLVGAGIGVTPLLSMAHALRATGKPFVLHDYARSRTLAPLLAEAEAAAGPDRLRLHLSDEPATRLPLGELLAEPRPGTQVYCCGPVRFMDAVRAAGAAWPEDAIRFEAFQPLVDENFRPEPFSLRLRSTGAVLPVSAERSALEVLAENGVELASSCLLGTCGSCECGYAEGEPIHRDVVLSPRARRNRFIPCVSRARGELLLEL